MKPEQIADYGRNRKLQNTTDAAVWTEEFMRLVELEGMQITWGTMVGWFANAIEVGREAGRQAALNDGHDLHIEWLVLAETMREMADEMERKARHLRAKADYAEYKAHTAKAEHIDGYVSGGS